MPMLFRVSSLVLAALGVLALAACGDDTPGEDAGSAEAPYRESIDPERTARVASRALPKRDTPIEVGAQAPAFEALPEGKPAIVVFYRGHW